MCKNSNRMESLLNVPFPSPPSNIKGIVCGYFKTAPDFLRKEGEELRYLGKVREERYIINIKDLRWTQTDWQKFVWDVGLRPRRSGENPF